MNFVKRAMTSVVRNAGKSFILFLIIFIVATALSAALTVQRAITNTNANIRHQMRPLAALTWDSEAWEQWMQEQGLNSQDNIMTLEHLELQSSIRLTMEHVKQIAALPYVEWLNYSLRTQLNVPGMRHFTLNDLRGQQHHLNDPALFNLTGTSAAVPLAISEQVVEVVAGRGYFTEAEQVTLNDPIPVIIAERTAMLNDWLVGSIFEIPQRILFPPPNMVWDPLWGSEPEHIFRQRYLTFEIIGLFDVDIDEENVYFNNNFLQQQTFSLFTQFHLPNIYVVDIEQFLSVGHMDMFLYMDEAGLFPENHPLMQMIDGQRFFDIYVSAQRFLDELDSAALTTFFLLKNPSDMEAFTVAAEEILPIGTMITFRENGFAALEAPLATVEDIANWILVFAISAGLLIISLIITLLLRERRFEIGVYLSHGEKKQRIISQLLLEIMSVAFVAMTLAVFTGHIISQHVTTSMIANEIMATPAPEPWWSGGFDPFEEIRLPNHQRTPDELLAAFNVSMDGQTIALFYTVALSTVLLSTMIPVLYVLRLNPKKVLL